MSYPFMFRFTSAGEVMASRFASAFFPEDGAFKEFWGACKKYQANLTLVFFFAKGDERDLVDLLKNRDDPRHFYVVDPILMLQNEALLRNNPRVFLYFRENFSVIFSSLCSALGVQGPRNLTPEELFRYDEATNDFQQGIVFVLLSCLLIPLIGLTLDMTIEFFQYIGSFAGIPLDNFIPPLTFFFASLALVFIVFLHLQKKEVALIRLVQKSVEGSSPPSYARKEIFLSYRRDHALDWAGLAYTNLTSEGHSCFLDQEEMVTGDFEKQIKTAIKHCDTFTLLLSENSLKKHPNKDYLYEEIAWARHYRKKFIVVPLCSPEKMGGVSSVFSPEEAQKIAQAPLEEDLVLVPGKKAKKKPVDRKKELSEDLRAYSHALTAILGLLALFSLSAILLFYFLGLNGDSKAYPSLSTLNMAILCFFLGLGPFSFIGFLIRFVGLRKAKL